MARLISGGNAFICDECVRLCYDIITTELDAPPGAAVDDSQPAPDANDDAPAASDDDLDLSAFEADVAAHLLAGRARARMVEDLRGDQPWSVDLTEGVLTIGEARHRAQILGTYSFEQNTFMWAWANPGAAGWGASLQLAEQLKARGDQPGQAVYAQRVVSAQWVGPDELVYVAAEIGGHHPVFVGSYDGGQAYLAITDLTVDLSTFPLVYVPGVITDGLSTSFAGAPACIAPFFAQLGLNTSISYESGTTLVGERGGGRVTVRFDELGRVAEVTVTAG